MNQDLSEEYKKQLANFSNNYVHVKFFHIDEELVKPIQNRKENYLRADFFMMSIFIAYSFQGYFRNMIKPFTLIVTPL